MVTLVVLTLDDGLVNALVRLRATGLPVSVVHVVDEPAADSREAPASCDAALDRRGHPLRPGRTAPTTCTRPFRQGPWAGTPWCDEALARSPVRRRLRRSRGDGRRWLGAIATPTIAPLLLAAAAVATLAGGAGHRPPARLAAGPAPASRSARTCWLGPRCPCRRSPRRRRTARLLRWSRSGPGGRAYALDVFPLEVAAKADVRLLLSLVVYAAIWLAAFLALSLRRPLPAIVVLLVLLGFGFTTDASARNVWATLAFLLLAGSMLVLSRSLQRERWKSTDVAAGAITAMIAAVLALSIVGTTSVAAGRPLSDWRTWDIVGVGNAHLRFDWMQNYPRPPRSARRRARHARPLGGRLVLAGQRARQLRRRELVGRRSRIGR